MLSNVEIKEPVIKPKKPNVRPDSNPIPKEWQVDKPKVLPRPKGLWL